MNVPILHEAAPLLSQYDVVFCDVWGVLHDGIVGHPEAARSLVAYRHGGGTVVLISNAPATAFEVATLLDRKGVPRDAWDAIVTSGDLTRLKIEESRIERIFHIGADRGEHVFEGLGVALVDVHRAQAVVATELTDYYSETPDDYRPVLEVAAARGLPFICANPDLVVHVGDDLLPCAGALAVIFEEIGGAVYWAGKPHPPIYERALELAQGRRGRGVTRSRILAIGDALRTDIAGATAFGIDSLLIAGGIHREELLRGTGVDEGLLERLMESQDSRLVGAMTALA